VTDRIYREKSTGKNTTW